jgi:hypothetical protein
MQSPVCRKIYLFSLSFYPGPPQSIQAVIWDALPQGNGWHYCIERERESNSVLRTGIEPDTHVWPRPWNWILFCVIDPWRLSSIFVFSFSISVEGEFSMKVSSSIYRSRIYYFFFALGYFASKIHRENLPVPIQLGMGEIAVSKWGNGFDEWGLRIETMMRAGENLVSSAAYGTLG